MCYHELRWRGGVELGVDYTPHKLKIKRLFWRALRVEPIVTVRNVNAELFLQPCFCLCLYDL